VYSAKSDFGFLSAHPSTAPTVRQFLSMYGVVAAVPYRLASAWLRAGTQIAVALQRAALGTVDTAGTMEEARKPARSNDELADSIRTRAYELYERRGRRPGHELDDWLRAQADVLGRATPV
jgi:hypothetical protein